MSNCTFISHFNARLFALAVIVFLPASLAAEPTIDLEGRLHLDYAFYDSDRLELGDGGEVRRARLGVEGLLTENWGYGFSVDFAGGETEIKDALLAYTGLPRGNLLFGQFKQPFSLSNLTSSKYLTFIERPLPVELATDRRLGVGYFLAENHYSFAVSAYGQNVETEGEDEGLGAGARFTWAPVHTDDRVLHFGVAAAWEEAPDASETLRIRTRPESHVTDVRLIDTGTLTEVDSLNRFGVEAASVFGPFSLQGEYLVARIDRQIRSDVDVGGWYVFARYFLTGESRPYGEGVFGRVKPLDDSGAWEVALRYSRFDLNDDSVRGGEEDNITLGLNYYLTSHLKFQVNHVWIDATRHDTDESPRALNLRIAYDF